MSVAILVSASEALDVAQQVANSWSETAADRDIDGQSPTLELGALSDSGLLGVTVPQSHGGAAIGPRDLAEVFRILARADLSLAQIAQNHFDFVDVLGSAIRKTRDSLYMEVLRGKRFGNALAEFGGDGERTLLAQLQPTDGGGYVLDSVKVFATGALTADWIPVHVILPDIGVGVAYISRNAPGVLVEDDWDAFGQRATKSGTVRFNGAEVDSEFLVFRGGHGRQLLAAGQAAGNQLLMAALELGAAEGILDRLKDFDATSPRLVNAWSAQVAAAAATFDTAARLVTAAVQDGSEGSDRAVSSVVRAHAGVNLAKAATYQLSTSIAEEYLADGFANLDEPAVDRLWRNARVHTLHDSVSQRIRDVGALVLSGQFTTAGGQLQEISGFGESIELGV